MTIHEAILALLDQIDADENGGGLLSRDTLKRASELRHAYLKLPFVQGQRVKKVTGDYHAGGVVLAAFPMFPENPESPVRIAVRHNADEGFFVHIYGPDNLANTDRTIDADPNLSE